MPLSNQQKCLVHRYARAAQLTDLEYRAILRRHAGVASCSDPEFSQSGYDETMAGLEAILEARLASGVVPPPGRAIRDLCYWRRRRSGGRINSRQYHAITQAWRALLPSLPKDKRTPEYLAAIVAKATGRRDVGASALSSRDAGLVLDALKDRLHYAHREQSVTHERIMRMP